MPTKQIVLKKSEIDQLIEGVERLEVGRIMMKEGAKIVFATENSMWEKIKEIAPDAITFSHPRVGKWTFEIKEKHELPADKR